jgi:hypothetical protein
MLFDLLERNDEGPAGYAEPEFTYLNRSARPEVGTFRETFERWFERFPDNGRADLRARFRSENDSQHRPALFELLLHESLVQLRCRVTVHPAGTTRGHPDFRVECGGDGPFYLEAVVASDETEAEAGARARMNTVYDALDRLDSPDFFIGLDLRGAPDTPPPARRIRSFLAQRLSALDPEAVGRLVNEQGWRSVPHWRFEHEGWRIEFYPIPKSARVRGQPGVRPLAAFFRQPQSVSPSNAIKDAVVRKGQRYGDVDLPYVVAVNALGLFVGRGDVVDALFGHEQIVVPVGPNGPGPERFGRAPDGAWMGPAGPQYTRISGVLLATRLDPWNIPTAPVCLYHNPWARRPIPPALTSLPRAVAREGRLEFTEGRSLGDVLGWSCRLSGRAHGSSSPPSRETG